MLTPSEGNASQTGVSLRAYARHRGTSVEAVRRAIKSKRLKASLVVDASGHTKIGDPALADAEWGANTDLSKAPAYVKERGVDRPVTGVTQSVTPVTQHPETVTGVDDVEFWNLTEASAREKSARARLADLKYRELSSELIDRQQVLSRLGDVLSHVRTRILGVAGKFRSETPRLTHAEVAKLDELLREALEECSSGGILIQ